MEGREFTAGAVEDTSVTPRPLPMVERLHQLN